MLLVKIKQHLYDLGVGGMKATMVCYLCIYIVSLEEDKKNSSRK
jgi:hypothetical protein